MADAYLLSCDVDEGIVHAQAFVKAIYQTIGDDPETEIPKVLIFYLDNILGKVYADHSKAVAAICELERQVENYEHEKTVKNT